METKRIVIKDRKNIKEDLFMKRIIGVCACPAGIAHTYMAAENLERQGKKLGFQVKIETNGSGRCREPIT